MEVEAPEGYALAPTSHSVYVDTTDGDKQYTVTAENHKLPDMKIIKRDEWQAHCRHSIFH